MGIFEKVVHDTMEFLCQVLKSKMMFPPFTDYQRVVTGLLDSTCQSVLASWIACVSAKAKGKEPEVTQPFAIMEDKFKFVMGIFEKVTHDTMEFLCQNGWRFKLKNQHSLTMKTAP
ncbi:hypothetical protein BDR04DRAFT_1115356 [Suillus decipiens]|nr:hypothetical protein BDR04DRAFT_1115356 [Suillus decipiens]